MSRAPRLSACLEVCVAFAVMHVAFRAFKQWTSWGQTETTAGVNFSPGLAMILVSLLAIVLHRRTFAEHGVSGRRFLESANAALVCLVVLAVIGGTAWSLGFRYAPRAGGLGTAVGAAALLLPLAFVMLWVLQRFSRAVSRVPGSVTVLLLVAVPVLPIAAAFVEGRSSGPALIAVLWILIGSGIGEEMFFRGYVQSRLNRAFGKPFEVFGVRFGFGLFGAALLFGVVHVLNPVNYFSGNGSPAWGHGLTTAASLHFGFLREKTGSIVAPAVLHGFSNLLVRLPQLLDAG